MNQREAIQETMRRILRQTTLRAILRPAGKTPIEVTQAEADALLEPYEQAIDQDFAMCCEVADQLVAHAQRADAVAAHEEENAQPFRLTTDDEDPDS